VADSAGFDERPVRAFRPDPDRPVAPDRWPASVPAVAYLLRDGLELPAGLTVLVGENGSGKSTVMEILAEAYGLNPQGGSALARFRTRESEPGIGAHFIVERGPSRPGWSYFLRADTMHGLYTYLEANPGRSPERFHELSHGEGFLEVLRTRVNQPGFYLMDEPDAPLSFIACLGLVSLLRSSLRRPAPGSSSSAAGACARPAGTSWTSSCTGGVSCTSQDHISGIGSTAEGMFGT
jgi:predicted ATPase